jgi:hypothetical protein
MNIIREQTADLTEFRGEIKDNFDNFDNYIH